MPLDSKPTGLEKPNDAKKPSSDASAEVVIHVIPEKFYGAGLKMKAGPVPPPPAAAVPPPGVPGVPTPPVPPGKKDDRKKIIVIASGVLLLGIVGVVAFLLLRPAAPAPVANVVVPPPAPRAVCGDAKCEAPTETSATCSVDCGPPAPVCGNAKCEAPSETSVNCPIDCGPPAPVCGDAKCEAPTETVVNCSEDCKPPEPLPGTDTDSDGLSDQEERQVFGTDPSSPNTDRDSYVDLNEALNLFDPALPSPALLKDSKLMTAYAGNGYSLLRPTAWSVKESQDDPVMFNAPSGEFVSVLIQEKAVAQGIMDWYLAQAPGVTSSQVEPYKTRQGYDAILSPDRFTAYVNLGDHVAVVTYNLGGQANIQFRVTFQTMVQGLAKN